MVTEITPSVAQGYTENNLQGDLIILIEGLVGLTSAGSATVVNVIENPLYDDLVIMQAILNVVAASGNVATDLDIGLADDDAGTNIGAELADGLVAATLNATGHKDLGAVHAIATPPTRPIWKAKGYATDSFIATIQRGNVDADTLDANLWLRCVKATTMD